MKFIESSDKLVHYNGVLRDIVTGKRGIPATQISGDRKFPHLSDLTNACHTCPLDVYYNYTRDVPFSDDTILTFILGRAFERTVATELKPVTVDGIVGTVDGICELDNSLLEIKTSGKSSKWFKPEEQTEWISRMLGYAHMFGATMFTLMVFFKRGNYGDKREEIKVYDFEFSDEEVKENWHELLDVSNRVGHCLLHGHRPDNTWVYNVLPKWKCSEKYCRYYLGCEYVNE